jgi:hypothetical protein
MRYKIHKVGVLSAGKLGFVIGAIVSLLPTLFGTLLIAWVVGGLHELLSKWDQVELGPAKIDLVEKLGLGDLFQFLSGFDNIGIYILTFVVGILLAGLVWAALGALAALAYNNLSAWVGGLDVTLATIPTEAGTPPQPSAAAPSPVPPVIPQPQTVSVGGGVAPSPGPGRPITPPPSAQAPVPLPQPSVVQPPTTYVPAPTVSGPRLLLASNPNQMWLINKPIFAIGSAPGSDLYAGGLEPQHAQIEFDQANRAYVLYDLSNGKTWVNERPVQGRNKLNDGFRVRVGQIELVFHV